MKDLPREEVFADDKVFERPETSLDFSKLLEQRPIELELCCGNGHFLADLAAREPKCGFVGVDRLYRRIAAAARKVRKQGLINVRLILDDADRSLRLHFGPDSLQAVYILFPDPWPKRRHHKNRLITDDFLEAVAERLKPAGELVIAHDHQEYGDWILERLQRARQLIPRDRSKPFDTAPQQDLPMTLYERKWRSLGRTIRYFRYIKVGQAAHAASISSPSPFGT